jgi:hypothetical protein
MERKPEAEPPEPPAEQAGEIGGDVNPYPVGEVRKALEDSRAEKQVEDTGSPFTRPLEQVPEPGFKSRR